MCQPKFFGGRVGLMWVGAKFYPTPGEFSKEAMKMGISKRISAIPNDFKLGETWVMLAHPNAVRTDGPYEDRHGQLDLARDKMVPGIFSVFKPIRIEKVLFKEDATVDELASLERRGITPVILNDDADHEGTVYDPEDEEDGADSAL